LDSNYSKTAQYFGKLKQSASAQMIGLLCPKIWYGLVLPSSKSVREFGPQNVQKPKMGDRKRTTLKWLKMEPHYLQMESSAESVAEPASGETSEIERQLVLASASECEIV